MLRRKNVEVLGRYSPIVTVPLPSQSPTIGRSPGAPYPTAMSGAPKEFVFLRKKKLLLGLKSPIVVEPVVVPPCMTVKVCPAIVIVAVREAVLVLGATEKFTVPLPVDEAPDVIVRKLGTLLKALQLHPEPVVS